MWLVVGVTNLLNHWFVIFFELFKHCRPTANEELPFCLATRLGVFPQPRFRFSTHHLTLDSWCLVVTCVLLENDYAIARLSSILPMQATTTFHTTATQKWNHSVHLVVTHLYTRVPFRQCGCLRPLDGVDNEKKGRVEPICSNRYLDSLRFETYLLGLRNPPLEPSLNRQLKLDAIQATS